MHHWRKLVAIASISVMALAVASWVGAQQETKKAATLEDFKGALENFHEIMAEVFHGPLPAKDYTAVRESISAVVEKRDQLVRLGMPEALTARKEKFQEYTTALATAVDSLQKVGQGSNNEKLVAAFEDMHLAYMKLKRLVTPPVPAVPAVEDFHTILHPLWHEALPKADFPAIIAAAPKFAQQREMILQVQLPQRLQGKAAAFDEKRKALSLAVDAYLEACKKKNQTLIKDRFSKMHEAYENLEAVLGGS